MIRFGLFGEHEECFSFCETNLVRIRDFVDSLSRSAFNSDPPNVKYSTSRRRK